MPALFKLGTLNVPLNTFSASVNVLLPERTIVPGPAVVKAKPPPIMPLSVSVSPALSTLIWLFPARVILPA